MSHPNWKELRKAPKLVPYPPKEPVKDRATKRNEARLAKIAARDPTKHQPKKPRPPQEIIEYVVPPRKEKKKRKPNGRFTDTPHSPTYVSSAGYRSRQKEQSALNKKPKTRSHSKGHRLARQSRAVNSRKERARRKALDR